MPTGGGGNTWTNELPATFTRNQEHRPNAPVCWRRHGPVRQQDVETRRSGKIGRRNVTNVTKLLHIISMYLTGFRVTVGDACKNVLDTYWLAAATKGT